MYYVKLYLNSPRLEESKFHAYALTSLHTYLVISLGNENIQMWFGFPGNVVSKPISQFLCCKAAGIHYKVYTYKISKTMKVLL